MKKYLALLLVLVMVLSLAACASKPAETTEPAPAETTDTTPTEETKEEEPAPAEETKTEEEPAETSEYAVAMITDYGDITDQSFNQTTYEACKAFCEDNGVDFSYFKPAGDNTADRVAMIEKAVDEGYNVIVMPGYAFGGAIVEAAPEFPEVKFIALDVGKGDLLEAGVAKAGESYDYNPDNWDLDTYVDTSTARSIRKSSAATWPATLLSSWATRASASWAAWLSPLLSAMATASCRALTLRLLIWACPTSL